jgi:hypothetical protein
MRIIVVLFGLLSGFGVSVLTSENWIKGLDGLPTMITTLVVFLLSITLLALSAWFLVTQLYHKAD